MKTKISILLCAVLTLASPGLYAATHVVLPGQSIQSTITAASPGDQIIVKGGIYVESITIDKNLDFRREAGTVVHINGNVTLSGITGAFTFAHFKIGSANNKTLTVTNCADVYMEDVNATGGGGLSVTNSKVRGKHCWFSTTGNITGATEFYFYDCSFGGNVTFTSSNWTMQECSITGNLTSNTSDTIFLRSNVTGSLTHNLTGDSNCTVFQSTIGERLHSKAGRSWIGYNTIRWVRVDANATIVGNEIDGRDGNSIGIYVSGANSEVFITNNKIHHHGGNRSSDDQVDNIGVGVWIAQPASSSTKVFNNNIWDCKLTGASSNGGAYDNNNCGMGIYVQSTGSTLIQGNIIWNCYSSPSGSIKNASVYAPFEKVLMTHNNLRTRNPTGGVVGTDNLDVDPQFDANQSLIGGSPCIDAGPPEVEFKDHDLSRNDMGAKGGHHFDANGASSSIPVVLSGNLSPIRIQKGVTGTVNLNSRAVVSTPKQ